MNNVVMIMLVLGAVVTLQFFKGRKINLMIMEHYAKKFEKLLRPKDQLYTWLGGYIGFRVNYEIDSETLEKIEMTLTLLPRHSVLYMPVSLITARHDKLYVVFRPKRKVRTDIQIIRKGYYIFKPRIEEEPYLQKEVLEVNGKKFTIMYRERKEFDRFFKRIKDIFDMARVIHIALVSRTNVLYVFLRPSADDTPREIRKAAESIEKLIQV
ncbi:MAG: hypothetical protein J7L41_08425 [Synergistetes bacterium]|nr:hypothetical protein [Synergistota bacterium]